MSEHHFNPKAVSIAALRAEAESRADEARRHADLTTGLKPKDGIRGTVLLGLPMSLGYCRVEFAISLCGTVLSLAKSGWRVMIHAEDSGSIVQSRNTAVAVMLSNPGITHLAFFDSDQSWEPVDATAGMLDVMERRDDVEVLGGIYVSKRDEPFLCVQFHGDVLRPVLDADGLLEVDALPTGMMVLKRSVFDKLKSARPDLHITFKRGQLAAYDANMFLFFDQRPNAAHDWYLTDDFGFCETWRGLGGRMHAYPPVTIHHHWMTSNRLNLQEYLMYLGAEMRGVCMPPPEPKPEK